MEYFLNRFDHHFASEKDYGTSIFAGCGLTVQVFHLKQRTSLMEGYGDASLPNGNHIVVYLVMKGKVDFHLEDESVIVEAGQTLTVEMNQNFSVWALEDSDLFSIHNCVETSVDNTPQELVAAVTKVERNDTYLRGHNYRVGKYSTLMMQAMAPEHSTTRFHLAAAYHDVGKIVVPSEVLNKPGRLTPEEFAEIKKHPAASYDILKEFIGPKTASFARWHHEKLDGSGYPDGIKGDDIPIESRVMAVADVFDALTTSRCYRGAFTSEKALDIIRQDVENGKLDADVYNTLKHMVENGSIDSNFDDYTGETST